MSPKTRRGYVYQAGSLLRFSGKDSSDDVTQEDVDRFREAQSLGKLTLSAVSIEAAVKAAGILRGERFSGAKLRAPLKRPQTVPLDDLSAVFRIAKKRGNCLMGRFLKWSYITGARLGDLLRMTREQMAAESGVVEFEASKSGKYHAVPKHPILDVSLPACRLPLKKSPDKLRKRLRIYCEAAGVPYFTPQMIRRTAATQYELARPGAGAIIQGSGLKRENDVFWKYYADQVEILREAQTRLAIPEAMMFKDLRKRRGIERRQMQAAFDRLSAADRETVLRMVSRLA